MSDPGRLRGRGGTWNSVAGVDKDISTINESTSTFREISATAALLLSASSHVNSASIRRISVEEDGVTYISLIGSQSTLARHHNSVIRTGKGRDVCVCFALIAISWETSSPKSIRILDMIEPRQAHLG
ncbi:hypothetical protein H5410_045688 [Solanum commersonii]|uniref:Uncharacterized protein n=1 Tax=Solanum commersonii TaxID=4109 RepID=A0A9J5XDG1_SOLCO|nr:hypothetical protein H5410_045688 [Solanum commersonii]